MQARQFFPRELKEQSLIHTVWKLGEENESDLFAKNLGGAKCDKHTSACCGNDQHVKGDSQLGEGVRGEQTPQRDSACETLLSLIVSHAAMG